VGHVKNITVSVPEEVYRAARVRAAEEGSSVSALVTHYLRSLEERESEFARLEALQERVIEEIGQFRGADRLDRDELHTRAVR
jgi:plasmid stability protein